MLAQNLIWIEKLIAVQQIF